MIGSTCYQQVEPPVAPIRNGRAIPHTVKRRDDHDHCRSCAWGVDTHRDVHVAAALDPLGGVLGSESFPTDVAGYQALLGWLAWYPGIRRLSFEDREQIALGLARRESLRTIAQRLGRSTSTISREVKANGGRRIYRAFSAHNRAYRLARRPKAPKLDHQPLAEVGTEWLEAWCSPEEIANRLPIEFAHDPMMRVSHETVYQSIYVPGRGELRRELARCLRSSRAQRKPRVPGERRGRMGDMVMISERPGEVADRAVPGHWEGDLVIGKMGRSQVGTLVERSTGYLVLVHLPGSRDAPVVAEAMRKTVRRLPRELMRSITWDQGREMAAHGTFTVATGVQVYFCDPHSPW